MTHFSQILSYHFDTQLGYFVTKSELNKMNKLIFFKNNKYGLRLKRTNEYA